MQVITTLSVSSTQGVFFLQDLQDNQKIEFFRERELYGLRALSNKLTSSDVICITLTEQDTICDVIDYCSEILKVLPNTKVREILLNDTLVNGKAEKIEYYINELIDLLGMSNLPIIRVTKFKEEHSKLLSSSMVCNICKYLEEVFNLRIISKKSFKKLDLSTLRCRTSNKRKISKN